MKSPDPNWRFIILRCIPLDGSAVSRPYCRWPAPFHGAGHLFKPL